MTTPQTPEEARIGLLAAMVRHDDNGEAHYLRSGWMHKDRINLCWAWSWLTWGFGPYISVHPTEFVFGLDLGPLAVSISREPRPHNRGGGDR